MDRRQIERVTSPAVAVAVVVCAALVVFDPDRAMLWIVPAPIVAAIGCLLGMQLSIRMRATAAAFVFFAEALFWLGAAAFLVRLFVTRS